MLRATLKGLLAHRLRLALTALAIVLGVGFVAGTYVLTDTINKAFENVFGDVYQGVDVAVRSRDAFRDQQGGSVRAPLPAALLQRIQAVDGVQAAQGSVTGFAQLIGKDGKPVTTGGAPTLGVSTGGPQDIQTSVTLRSGRLPSGPGEVAVDARTAQKEGFVPGDRVRVLLPGPTRTFTVSGIVGFGQADNLAGATLAVFDLPTAQQVLDRQGVYDEIDVRARPGVDPGTLRDRVAAVLPPSAQALTGNALAAETTREISKALGFFSTALLAFAGVALFVGAFLIFNTFAIIIAQRLRELALLRCLGASRRQVLGSVLLESLVVGLVASLVGLAFGLVIAIGLRALLKSFGIDLPSTATQFLPRTAVVSLAIGLGVTLASTLLPALRATRVPPLAALREEATVGAGRAAGRRSVAGALLTAVGVGLLLVGLFRDVANRLSYVGAGAVVVFLGVAVLSPLLVRPLASAIGWPIGRVFRLPGRLARENAMRSPRRTASTAAALMIGLALVAFVSIFAASIKRSTSAILDQAVAADFMLTTASFQPFSPEVARRVAALPEIQAVAGMRLGSFKLRGATKQLTAVDPAAYDQVVRTTVTAGSLAALADGGVAVKDTTARTAGLHVGDTLPMEFPRGGVRGEPVRAIFQDNHISGGDYLLSLRDYQAGYPDQQDVQVFVKVKPGVAGAQARAAIGRALADFPNVEVRDQAEYKAQQAKQVDQLLGLVSALLGLAIVIALIGIVNTLALSIFERVRELGLLRAVGATRGQLRSMIRWEAVIIAVLGAILGLAVGAFFGWAMVRALRDQGITEFSVPGGQLVGYVLAAAVAGILAAVLPGRRAAKVDVLRAVTTE